MTALPPSAALLQAAVQKFAMRDFPSAESLLDQLLAAHPGDGNGLHLLGLVRTQQGRLDDAVALLEKSIAASPRHALTRLNLGKILIQMDRDQDAAASFRAALELDGGLAAAHFELGNALHRLKRGAEAEGPLRAAVALQPGDATAANALAALLLDLGKYEEAEVLCLAAIPRTGEAELLGKLWVNLALSRRGKGDHAGVLAACEFARPHAPQLIPLDSLRADALDALNRHDEALAVLEGILAREPLHLVAQAHYNSLLYRLERPEFLSSFDRAPQTPHIRAMKASLLIQRREPARAEALYAGLAAEMPDEVEFMTGMGVCLAMQHRFAEAAVWHEKSIARDPHNASLHGHLANTLLNARDPQKALVAARRGHALAPEDQSCLALMGTALRALGDPEDELLNGYDHLIRIFDLEPPRGFTDMEAFNAELSGYLDGLHPETREFLEQSLRGGTQTTNQLFGMGHDLVERLRERIEDAVARYIRELRLDEHHPFARRRTQAFRMAGSWSSRLKDKGFHANHIHPSGWISSCYYARVPYVVADTQARQGWIKFGEPSFDAGLDKPVRRAIQPHPGRLVLFPSYMWHGTVAFAAPTVRTTIAFDVVPA